MLSWVLQPPPLPPWVAQSVSADWQLHAVSVERRKGEPVGRRVVPPTQVTFGEVQGYCGVTVVPTHFPLSPEENRIGLPTPKVVSSAVWPEYSPPPQLSETISPSPAA